MDDWRCIKNIKSTSWFIWIGGYNPSVYQLSLITGDASDFKALRDILTADELAPNLVASLLSPVRL